MTTATNVFGKKKDLDWKHGDLPGYYCDRPREQLWVY